MKKTLLISEIFPPIHGGSGRWFWELYSRLPKNQYVIAAGKSKDATQFDQSHNLNLNRLNLSSIDWGLKSRIGASFYWRTYWELKKIVKSENINFIHCGRCLPEGVMGYLIYLTMGIPYICYIHGEDIEAAATSRELSWLVGKVLKNAKKLICNSKNTAQLVTKRWPNVSKNINVLNPGVDINKFKPASLDSDFQTRMGWAGRQVILTVGRLQKRKGQDMMIKALPEIINRIPNAIYAIVGDGEELEPLRALARKLNALDYVQFLTEINDEDLLKCYQQCDLFILPNRTEGQDIEGFGMVLVEAQACGKPVIAGDSGGTVETMDISKTGFIVDCTDANKISTVVTDLLNDKQKIATMGENAARFSSENFSWEKHKEIAKGIFNIRIP